MNERPHRFGHLTTTPTLRLMLTDKLSRRMTHILIVLMTDRTNHLSHNATTPTISVLISPATHSRGCLLTSTCHQRCPEILDLRQHNTNYCQSYSIYQTKRQFHSYTSIMDHIQRQPYTQPAAVPSRHMNHLYKSVRYPTTLALPTVSRCPTQHMPETNIIQAPLLPDLATARHLQI